MRKVKKLISLLLTCVILFGMCGAGTTVVAAERSPIPVVYIKGQGSNIYADTNDNKSELLNKEKVPAGLIPEMLKGLIGPFFNAYAKNDFTDYCDKVVDIYSPYYERLALDENGEIPNGSGNVCNQALPTKDKKINGTYGVNDYGFIYDWRLDPFYTAEHLNDYIEAVKKVTGSDKVNIIGRCLGMNIVLAYFCLYGYDSVENCVIYNTGMDGFEFCGAAFSGQFVIDPDALERFVNSTLEDDDDLISVLKALVTVVNSLRLLGWTVDEVMDFYDKVYENVIPRMLKVSFGTFPTYWSMVGEEYYDDAKALVFAGEEEKYAGLIEKIDRYYNTVTLHVYDILDEAIDNGVKVSIISKYGWEAFPLTDNANLQGDGEINIISQTGGATCTRIGETFDAGYLAEAEENGTAKYISPDNEVDMSTSFLPDHTWCVKNLHHPDMPASLDDFCLRIFAYDGWMTINDDPAYPQYMLYDGETKQVTPLTEENCVTEREKSWNYNGSDSFTYLLEKLFGFIEKIVTMILNAVHYGKTGEILPLD